ncbi:putative quinol monooxygenase [Microbulbifer epialgicus]|uniref:Quinol monooxygenase n=1 Tax=Microbulbifer epialgicus TaxID=393907 RepID=A0ABV4P3L6_9GAMM
MNKMEVKLVVSFTINDYEKFQEVAEECSEYVADNEPGTLVYEWYVDRERAKGKLFETYENMEALEAHMLGAVFQRIGLKFKKSITWNTIESFGHLPEIFYEILDGLPIVNWAEPDIVARKK